MNYIINKFNRTNYKNGKEDGSFKYFSKNGEVKTIGNYKEGNPHGTWEWFDEDGNLTGTEEYKDGVLQE